MATYESKFKLGDKVTIARNDDDINYIVASVQFLDKPTDNIVYLVNYADEDDNGAVKYQFEYYEHNLKKA